MLESVFNRVAGPKVYNFIKRLQPNRRFPVNFFDNFFYKTLLAASLGTSTKAHRKLYYIPQAVELHKIIRKGRDTLKAFDELKKKQQMCRSNVFVMSKYIHLVHYTLSRGESRAAAASKMDVNYYHNVLRLGC